MDEIKDRKSEDTKMKESLRKLADSIGAEAKREERGSRSRGKKELNGDGDGEAKLKKSTEKEDENG